MGKGASGSTRTYNYYSSVIGAVCWGPVDVLDAVIVDGKTVVTGPITRGPEDWVSLDLDTDQDKYLHWRSGRMVLFWGTTPASTSPLMSAAFPTENHFAPHPDYRGMCVLAIRGLLFGRERTTAPNIEVIVGRKPVVDVNLVAAIHNTLSDGQCNPVAALAELLTSANGAGLSTGTFLASDWLAAAEYCADDPARFFCSPIVTSQTEARSACALLLDMFDGALYWSSGGLLGLRLVEPGIDPGDLACLSAEHFTQRPRMSGVGWADVPTQVSVRYADRDANYKDRAANLTSLLALRSRGLSKSVSIERPYVTRAVQASAIAAEHVRRTSRPAGSIDLVVRRAFAGGLTPGAKVLVDVDPEPGGDVTSQMCVVQNRREDGFGAVNLTVLPDTLADAVSYSPAPATDVPEEVSCDPIDDAGALAVPLPSATWPTASVAVLTPRPDATVTGMRVFFAWDSDGDSDLSDEIWADIGTQVGFACRMTLDEDVDDGETAIDLTLSDGATGPDAYLTARLPDNAHDAEQDALLLVLANVDGDGRVVITGGQPELEFCSVVSRVAVDSDSHTYTCLRARKGLPARSWSAAAAPRCYILPGTSLQALTHSNMSAMLTGGAIGGLRMVAYSAQAVDETTPRPEISFVMPSGYYRLPVVVWTAPAGSVGTKDAMDKFTPDFTVQDADGDLVNVVVSSRLTDGTGYVEHDNETFDQTLSHAWSEEITFASGTQILTVTATDRYGHVTTSTRTIEPYTGGVSIGVPTLTPAYSDGFVSWFAVTIGVSAPADSLQFVVGAIGSTAPTGGWTEVSALTKALTLTSSRRIWARAKQTAGPVYSDWTFADYVKDVEPAQSS